MHNGKKKKLNYSNKIRKYKINWKKKKYKKATQNTHSMDRETGSFLNKESQKTIASNERTVSQNSPASLLYIQKSIVL